jgi:hypothetical protein
MNPYRSPHLHQARPMAYRPMAYRPMAYRPAYTGLGSPMRSVYPMQPMRATPMHYPGMQMSPYHSLSGLHSPYRYPMMNISPFLSKKKKSKSRSKSKSKKSKKRRSKHKKRVVKVQPMFN